MNKNGLQHQLKEALIRSTTFREKLDRLISKHQILFEPQKKTAWPSAELPILVIFGSTFERTFCQKNVVRRRDGSDEIVGAVFTSNRKW